MRHLCAIQHIYLLMIYRRYKITWRFSRCRLDVRRSINFVSVVMRTRLGLLSSFNGINVTLPWHWSHLFAPHRTDALPIPGHYTIPSNDPLRRFILLFAEWTDIQIGSRPQKHETFGLKQEIIIIIIIIITITLPNFSKRSSRGGHLILLLPPSINRRLLRSVTIRPMSLHLLLTLQHLLRSQVWYRLFIVNI